LPELSGLFLHGSGVPPRAGGAASCGRRDPKYQNADAGGMMAQQNAIERAARAHGIGVRRVIFDVNLQPKLAATATGFQVMKRLAFNKQQAWVRHDEHYHVDFRVLCRPADSAGLGRK
jgi:murein endopeptidase